MAESQFVYVTYIRTTTEKLWRALMEPEFTRQYWCETIQECEWKPGAPWRLLKPNGTAADSGEGGDRYPEAIGADVAESHVSGDGGGGFLAFDLRA
jgi:hypothetical protein